ncbi:MAG: hypothetical protein ACO24M_05150, partial [Limnohabitans sp.]
PQGSGDAACASACSATMARATRRVFVRNKGITHTPYCEVQHDVSRKTCGLNPEQSDTSAGANFLNPLTDWLSREYFV